MSCYKNVCVCNKDRLYMQLMRYSVELDFTCPRRGRSFLFFFKNLYNVSSILCSLTVVRNFVLRGWIGRTGAAQVAPVTFLSVAAYPFVCCSRTGYTRSLEESQMCNCLFEVSITVICNN